MNEHAKIEFYEKSLNGEQLRLFHSIRKLMLRAYPNIQETIFVKQPYFYLPEYVNIKPHHRPSIMMSFFGNHVNIFAKANAKYEKLLAKYDFTDKHTMQIRLDQPLEEEVLLTLFKESLRL